jgi:hypothetical protein
MPPIEMDNQSVFKVVCRLINFAAYFAGMLAVIAA